MNPRFPPRARSVGGSFIPQRPKARITRLLVLGKLVIVKRVLASVHEVLHTSFKAIGSILRVDRHLSTSLPSTSNGLQDGELCTWTGAYISSIFLISGENVVEMFVVTGNAWIKCFERRQDLLVSAAFESC